MFKVKNVPWKELLLFTALFKVTKFIVTNSVFVLFSIPPTYPPFFVVSDDWTDDRSTLVVYFCMVRFLAVIVQNEKFEGCTPLYYLPNGANRRSTKIDFGHEPPETCCFP